MEKSINKKPQLSIHCGLPLRFYEPIKKIYYQLIIGFSNKDPCKSYP